MLQDIRSIVADGKIFSATFFKRSDGSKRKMICRTGVVPKGGTGQRSYDPEKHNLLLVWDMQKRGYRTIALEGLISLRAHGREIISELAA